VKSYVLIFFIILSKNLLAGGFFEPSLGFSTGTYKDKDMNMLLGLDEGFAKGFALAFKGGYSGSLIFLGADIGLRIMVLEADYGTSDSNAGLVGVQPGLIAGIHLPILPLRIWTGIYGGVLVHSHEESIIQTKWSNTYSGSVFKIGAGFNIFPLLSINVEFSQENITKVKREVKNTALNLETESEIEFEENKPKISTITISLSIPIEFWKGTASKDSN
jgi:hypothetical protein